MRDQLSNRTARVKKNCERGDSAPHRQGFPQGAVLSPLLFPRYIDDLRSVVPETVRVALFADAVSLINSHYNKLVAEKELQRAVSAVAEWTISKKMVHNADKCEAKVFSIMTFIATKPAFITISSRNYSQSHWTGC